jgi:hypothetical protein
LLGDAIRAEGQQQKQVYERETTTIVQPPSDGTLVIKKTSIMQQNKKSYRFMHTYTAFGLEMSRKSWV